jgi:acyl-CoA reductase-like NAD-dependent aldehyde dehydrogenase
MKMIIGGQKVGASSGEEIAVTNPATQEAIDTVPSAAEEDIARCLEYAQLGKKEWGAAPVYARSTILQKAARAILECKAELADLLSRESGKPIWVAENEVVDAASKFESHAEKAKHMCGEVMPDAQPGVEKDIVFTRREPLGVVVCIIPFNYPLILAAQKMAPALAAGNAIIVKPATDDPLALMRMCEILLECGVPMNALQVVTGKGSALGKWLVSTPKINAVSLTGSTEVGVQIAEYAAPFLHRVFLELGGNDPFIVFDDADLDLAVSEAICRVYNSGQTCMSPKRFLVQNGVKEAFVNRLKDALLGLTVGDPSKKGTFMGCLISEKAARQVEAQVDLTIKQGARCVYGGTKANGAFYQPTVLIDVTAEMDAARNMEIFGPVFPIIEFSTREEAVRIANSSHYGLSGGVFSADIGKAVAVASELETGTVAINGSGLYLNNEIAFGGYKMSGLGREGVSCSIEEMSQVKNYALKSILKN